MLIHGAPVKSPFVRDRRRTEPWGHRRQIHQPRLSCIPAALIAGDGIGPEIVAATAQVLDALGAPFDWARCSAGLDAATRFCDLLPEATLASIRRTRLTLKGLLEIPSGGAYRSIHVRLREAFKLDDNLRPARIGALGSTASTTQIAASLVGAVRAG